MNYFNSSSEVNTEVIETLHLPSPNVPDCSAQAVRTACRLGTPRRHPRRRSDRPAPGAWNGAVAAASGQTPSGGYYPSIEVE